MEMELENHLMKTVRDLKGKRDRRERKQNP